MGVICVYACKLVCRINEYLLSQPAPPPFLSFTMQNMVRTLADITDNNVVLKSTLVLSKDNSLRMACRRRCTAGRFWASGALVTNVGAVFLYRLH